MGTIVVSRYSDDTTRDSCGLFIEPNKTKKTLPHTNCIENPCHDILTKQLKTVETQKGGQKKIH